MEDHRVICCFSFFFLLFFSQFEYGTWLFDEKKNMGLVSTKLKKETGLDKRADTLFDPDKTDQGLCLSSISPSSRRRRSVIRSYRNR